MSYKEALKLLNTTIFSLDVHLKLYDIINKSKNNDINVPAQICNNYFNTKYIKDNMRVLNFIHSPSRSDNYNILSDIVLDESEKNRLFELLFSFIFPLAYMGISKCKENANINWISLYINSVNILSTNPFCNSLYNNMMKTNSIKEHNFMKTKSIFGLPDAIFIALLAAYNKSYWINYPEFLYFKNYIEEQKIIIKNKIIN